MNKIKRFFKKIHYNHCLAHHVDLYNKTKHPYRMHHANRYHEEMADYYFKELVKMDE